MVSALSLECDEAYSITSSYVTYVEQCPLVLFMLDSGPFMFSDSRIQSTEARSIAI